MTLKLATWNLERPWNSPHGVRASRLQHRIREVAADIWILTETADTFTLEGSTAHWSAGDSPPPNYDRSERAVAVHVCEDWQSELVERTQLSVAVSVRPPGAAPLLVAGHLIPYRDAYDGPRWQSHLQELQRSIVRWQAWRAEPRFAEHRLLVTGDFNMTLHDGRGYGTAKGRALIAQAMDECRLRCLTAVDIRRTEGLGIARDNVDHVFVDTQMGEAKEVSFWPGRVDGTEVSDHNGAAVVMAL